LAIALRIAQDRAKASNGAVSRMKVCASCIKQGKVGKA